MVVAGDRVHPATRELPLESTVNDVWYRWTTRPTGTVHTVARYRAPGAAAGDGTTTGGTDWPISWCRDYQGGRSFYTGLGRTAAAYGQQNLRKHLLGAIQWSAGLVRGGCKATILSNYSTDRVVNAASGNLNNTGESHGVAPASNGWVFYIGRADCRTDAERGAMIGQASSPKILDFANRNVGVGCGTIHILDPKAANGTVNSGVTKAGVHPGLRRPWVRRRGQRQDRDRSARHRAVARLRHHGPHLPAVLPDVQPGQPGPAGPGRR